MAHKIEFDDLFQEKLRLGSEAELHRITDSVSLALYLRFTHAALTAPRKRGGPAGSKNAPKPAEVQTA